MANSDAIGQAIRDQGLVSRKQFAEWCVDALRIHEASFTEPACRYNKTWAQAVSESTTPETWHVIVACLMTAGYADIWDWCKEQGVELS